MLTLIAAAGLGFAGSTFADFIHFTVATGSWTEPPHWSSGRVPTAADIVNIGGNRTVSLADGMAATANLLLVGNPTPGRLQATGGSLVAQGVRLGAWDRAEGVLSGGLWRLSDSLEIGGNGGVTFTFSGGRVECLNGMIGGSSAVTFSGGEWIMANHFFMGLISTGESGAELDFSAGKMVSRAAQIGYFGNTRAVVRMTGGSWAPTEYLSLGVRGSGSLILSGGEVSVAGGSGTLNLGVEGDGAGSLRLGDGGSVGTLDVAQVLGGAGKNGVQFAHGAYLEFKPLLAGRLHVSHSSNGFTMLPRGNTYAGSTDVTGGVLYLANVEGSATGSSDVLVERSGALAGSGSAAGVVTLEAGGEIAPRGGNLELGSLTWKPGGRTSFLLGTGESCVELVGALLKDGEGRFEIDLQDVGSTPGVVRPLFRFTSTNFRAEDFTLVNAGQGELVVTPTSIGYLVRVPEPPPVRRIGLQASRSGRRSVVYTLWNGGNQPEQFRVQVHAAVQGGAGGGPGGNPGYARRFLVAGKDLTKAAFGGGAVTPRVLPGNAVRMRLDFRRLRVVTRDRSVRITLLASSVLAPSVRAGASVRLPLASTRP